MTAGRSADPQPVYRDAREDDRAQLAEFDCSTGPAYEDEVESYVRHQALDLALNPGAQYRLLVFVLKRSIIAVSGFYAEVLVATSSLTGEASAYAATRLSPVAIRVGHQGSQLDSGRRLSDLVMETTIGVAMIGQPANLLNAIVHRDNGRSIALCERHGLTSRTGYDCQHDRMSGVFYAG